MKAISSQHSTPICLQHQSQPHFCQVRSVPQLHKSVQQLCRRPATSLQPASDDVHAPLVAVVAGLVMLPPAAVELYNSLQPKRCQCCVGTGFVLCSNCQGRGKQGLTLPGEAPSHSACPVCSRKGRCQCTECDGSGLENWWLWQPAADPGWGPRGN